MKSKIDSAVADELIRSLVKESRRVFIFHLFLGVITITNFYYQNIIISFELLVWFVSLVFISSIRALVPSGIFFKSLTPDFKYKFSLVCLLIVGALWGWSYYKYAPFLDNNSMLLQLLILVGITAGSIVSLASCSTCYHALSVPIITGVLVSRVLSTPEASLKISFIIIFYYMYISYMQKINNKMLIDNIKLRIKQNEIIRKLNSLSTTDDISKLNNHRAFISKLDELLKQGMRLKMPVALVLFDLDNFKLVNDNLGHIEGNNCLFEIGKIIKKNFERNTDFCARLGGDEFGIILFNESLESTAASSEKMLIDIRNLHYGITCSVGISSVIPTKKINLSEFIKFTDALLYKSKNTGKNKITVSLWGD